MPSSQASPKVSIVIPVYNGSNYLREAIDSALAQTYENLEILVVNDGSRDDGATEAIARSYGDKIRYFAKENGGTASALNVGVQNMEGAYFSWLSHDDLYLPDKIRAQMEALRHAPDNTVCACNVASIIAEGQVFKQYRIPQRASRSFRVFLALGDEAGLNGCSLLIPRSAFVEHGLFDERKPYTQDYDMWWRIAKTYGLVCLQNVLVYYRHHREQTCVLQGHRAFLDSDLIHMEMLQALSVEETRRYTAGNESCLAQAYDTFSQTGYTKMPAALLICAYRMWRAERQEERANRLLRKGVLGNLQFAPQYHRIHGMEDSLTTLLAALSEEKHLPRVLIYRDVWKNGVEEEEILRFIEALKDQYAFVLVSTAGRPAALPDGARHIMISDTHIPAADLLLRLSLLLGAAALIHESGPLPYFSDIAAAFRDSGIALAEVHRGDPAQGNAAAVVWNDLKAGEASGQRPVYRVKGGDFSLCDESAGLWRALLGQLLWEGMDKASEDIRCETAAYDQLLRERGGGQPAPDARPLAEVEYSWKFALKTSKLLSPARRLKRWTKKIRAQRNPVWR